MSITWNRKPLTFAVPQVGRTALLPQQAAVGTIARIHRLNETTFMVSANAMDGKPGTGRMCRVQAKDFPNGHIWTVQRDEDGTWSKPLGSFTDRHLRSALGMAVTDATVEYVIDRDWEEGR